MQVLPGREWDRGSPGGGLGQRGRTGHGPAARSGQSPPLGAALPLGAGAASTPDVRAHEGGCSQGGGAHPDEVC
eukprot:4937706-Pyramimonas_sp.AAC.2